jgi:hypothetical protein
MESASAVLVVVVTVALATLMLVYLEQQILVVVGVVLAPIRPLVAMAALGSYFSVCLQQITQEPLQVLRQLPPMDQIQF